MKETHPLSAPKSELVPHALFAKIGGYMGNSYSIELQHGTLVYSAFGQGYTLAEQLRITPTETQWNAFRKFLDDAQVWQWRAEYRNDGVVDGTHWTLDIAYEDAALKSSGSNGYPDAEGKHRRDASETRVFERYLAAVQELTGGKVFR